MANLNIPIKHEGDEVTHGEFNSIVDFINALSSQTMSLRILSAEDYKKIKVKETIFYAVVNGVQLDRLYFGAQLIAQRGKNTPSAFTYTFPITF